MEDLCEDEGCPHFGEPHVCVSPTESREARRERLQEAARDDESWCKFCGCGNDKWGYAHLPACTRPNTTE